MKSPIPETVPHTLLHRNIYQCIPQHFKLPYHMLKLHTLHFTTSAVTYQ